MQGCHVPGGHECRTSVEQSGRDRQSIHDGLRRPDDLLRVVDIDEIGDVETLLMFLFDRPIGIDELGKAKLSRPRWRVVLPGSGEAIGSVYDFPLSIIEPTRACVHMVDDLGPNSRDGFTPEESADVSAMGNAEDITALQQALGKVRFFNMMDADG